MSEAKFTPGPWQLKPRKSSFETWHTVQDAAGNDLAKIEITGTDWQRDADANVNLMLAAPEMYAALDEVAATFFECGENASARLIECFLAEVRGES